MYEIEHLFIFMEVDPPILTVEVHNRNASYYSHITGRHDVDQKFFIHGKYGKEVDKRLFV